MAASFEFAIDYSEIDYMLKELPKSIATAETTKALKTSGKIIQEEAIKNVRETHVKTGKLADSIKVSTKLKRSQRVTKNRPKSSVVVYIGSNERIAHLIEFGTSERHYKGKSTGRVTPTPFMRNAWDAKKRDALKRLSVELGNNLKKAAGRLRKRAVKGTLGKRARTELL